MAAKVRKMCRVLESKSKIEYLGLNSLRHFLSKKFSLAKTADATTLIQAMLEIAPGDQCCYLLFQSTAPADSELIKAMATAPKYKVRKTIVRGETFLGGSAKATG